MGQKEKVVLSILFFAFFVLLISPTYATVTVYSNTYLGLPDYDTFLNFDDTRIFSTIYHTGDAVYIDDYVFKVQNANLTINEFFDSPNYMELTVSGTAGTQSEVTINAEEYGYTHAPSSVTYTGVVTNQDTVKTTDGLTLYANHEVTGDVIYQIVWTGDTSTSGGNTGTNPSSDTPTDDTTTDDTTQPEPDNIIDDIVEEIDDFDNADWGLVLMGAAIVGILGTGAFVTQKKKTRKPKDAYKKSKRGQTKKPNYNDKYK